MEAANMNHEVKIIYREQCIARPWGCECNVCGIFAACQDIAEAEQCAKAHHEKANNAASMFPADRKG